LYPAVFGEEESVELFAKVLHHIVTFKLAVHQYINTNVFLPADGP
jgi:hypothetical protein